MRLAAPEQETELHAGVSPEARTGGGGGRGGPEVHREGPSPNKIKSQCRRGKRRVLWPKFHPQMRTWGRLRKPTPRHALRSPSVPCPRGARLRPLRFPLRCTGPREVDLGERERGVTFSSSLPPLLVCALLPRPDPPHRKKALLLAVRRLQRPGRRACCPAGRQPSPRLGPRAWVLRAPTGSTGRTGRDRKPEPRREGRPDSLRRGAGLPGHAGPRPLEATPPRRPCTCLLPGRCTSLLFFEKPVCRQ